MRVLLQGRPDLWALPAGDTLLVRRTVAALRERGVAAQVSTELRPDLRGCDLVHLFNLSRIHELGLMAQHASEHGVPYVLTPMYWDLEEYMCRCPQAEGEEVLRWRRDLPWRRKVLSHARAVLTTGEAEAALLRSEGVPSTVVPLACDQEGRPASASGEGAYVLCVGRITPQKNQLALIEALRPLGLPLVILGPVNDPWYLRRCRAAAGEQVRFCGPARGTALGAAFVGARVHALASWYELPGLASLEAAVAGCNVVSTDRGTAAAYLGPHARYCDPGRPETIREAVLAAWREPRTGRAGRRLRRFSWSLTARRTLEVYRSCLER